jgi:KUP system potassium uptake protein
MGVVFGDIGTSPLYTVKEVFGGHHPLPINADNVLGILSLVFWALTITVSLKYVVFIMRADNKGEGGIMALTALALRTANASPRVLWLMSALGIFGAALFYGDAVITPAMSVLVGGRGTRSRDAAAQALRFADHRLPSWSCCSFFSATARRPSGRCSAR